jgi:CheY-like chemotaxis protein
VPLRLAAVVPLEDDDTATPGSEPRGKALIVDDGHYNQVVLKGIALELGYAPEIASNAEQAEKLLAAHIFDVVFLDWELPGLKGGDVARVIRARPGGDAPVIVAVTAHDSAEIRRECESAGMDAYLLKPYDTERVKGCIARVRARRRGASVPTASSPAPALLSLAAFAHYARGASGDIGTAARLYMENVVHELARIEAARLDNDGEQLVAVAHQIRALGGLVGAKEVCFAAQTLEGQARTASPELRQSLCVALARELVRLQIEIADLTAASGARA